ncbi:hypothetical protein PHYBLDRAFT_68200 [Phycomyces blakesleeanus NRRL 1555(-)]|uniref:Uncharacterized protein n=1 Tax=Phycomyces blakesleeanus (strain ATCC 8743b / DSM 1359 / FGSC 10004 / NBRC 33097 / NRRL 1555) TaxID=763407 RepID=A0A162ZMH6_PHYB8|nr:hypothetical protein PHYBLDRAFT_68200 [Phycomyces blakesleeanus NRRL 1555(-)]OAD67831.1 hypothetical protein PHYBLDRAFT_68200 [Phycomyces blakesleeanus NRRL 1555(-)]|eukprot:XP_018285871.1 hypothetical protein PHYBLDRAFT_68200 [Phycomyces blakesleeanus NRRL 1555(-)]
MPNGNKGASKINRRRNGRGQRKGKREGNAKILANDEVQERNQDSEHKRDGRSTVLIKRGWKDVPKFEKVQVYERKRTSQLMCHLEWATTDIAGQICYGEQPARTMIECNDRINGVEIENEETFQGRGKRIRCQLLRMSARGKRGKMECRGCISIECVIEVDQKNQISRSGGVMGRVMIQTSNVASCQELMATNQNRCRWLFKTNFAFLEMKVLKNAASGESSASCSMLIEKPKDKGICMKEADTELFSEVSKQVGRKFILSEKHTTATINFIDVNPSVFIVEVNEHLLKRFNYLKFLREANVTSC